jgi:hypothetical protein
MKYEPLIHIYEAIPAGDMLGIAVRKSWAISLDGSSACVITDCLEKK